MKVVLDSSVIIAAFATRGLCADVLEYCLHTESLFLSEYILEEVYGNLCKKIKLPKHKADEILVFLSSEGKKVKPSPIPHNTCRDKDDLEILGTAVTAGADVIVTGDKDLLILKNYDFIPILTPREFWLFVQKKEKH